MVKNCWHKLNVTISLINQTVIVFFHFNKNCCKNTKYFKASISSEHGDSCPERSGANKQGDSLHTILPFHSPSLSPDLMDRYFPAPLPPPLSHCLYCSTNSIELGLCAAWAGTREGENRDQRLGHTFLHTPPPHSPAWSHTSRRRHI